jgi:Ca-activated chloride channel family protein
MLQDFHFIRPLWFIALVPALLLCAGLLWHQRDRQQWTRYIAPNLLPYLLDQAQIQQRRWPLLGLLALWTLAVVALAGPAWQKIPQPVERSDQALVICWDLSPSMLAEDIKPSRLMRSRLKLIDLLNERKDGQVALIAYSGEAYTVTPLTDDRGTIINLLPALTPTTLPTVGSNPEMALSQAIQLLKDGGIRRGDILFLTDEIEPSALATMADELARVPHQLTLWGVGTEQGAPIPLPDGGFAKGRQGDMVVARLNEERLRQFAVEQRAYYVPLVSNNSDIETLLQLLSPMAMETSRADRTFDQWFEHGQYLALLLLPFVALVFRRGWIAVLWLLPLLPMGFSPSAQALDWRVLWARQDQQAQQDLRAGDAEAAKRFSTPDRRGAALYQQGEFAAAAEEFAQDSNAAAAYNRGNALTRVGEFDKAIAAYDEALRQQPDFTQAKDNRQIAQQLAELQKQQQEQQNGDGEDQSDGDGDQQQNGQSNKGQPNKDQANQDQSDESQENGDGESSDGSESQMSDEEAQRRAEQQKLAEQQADEEENPFTQAAREQEERRQQDSEAQEQSDEAGQLQQALLETQAEPMTEEQQMLEQWLRKVPDDPGGLMREKFRYQYKQRRQSLRDNSSNNQAEQRW